MAQGGGAKRHEGRDGRFGVGQDDPARALDGDRIRPELIAHRVRERERVGRLQDRLEAPVLDARDQREAIDHLAELRCAVCDVLDEAARALVQRADPGERLSEATDRGERCSQVVARKRDEPGERLRVAGHEEGRLVALWWPRFCMSDTSNLLTSDLQASSPEVRIGLSRAGVTGISKAIRIGHAGREKLIGAEIDCAVDLDPAQKGVHMSRFPELFAQAIDEVVIGEALLVEVLAEEIARRIVEGQRACRAEVKIAARYPLERVTPVTGLPTQEMVSLIGIAAASTEGARRLVGVEATGINACPCAQGLVRGRASERLAGAGFENAEVERILDLVPLATHNQRGRGTLFVGTKQEIDAERLVEIVEGSMSSPVYELLKRPDELFVVEHAHLQPRFVEDSVRHALLGALEEYEGLQAGDFLLSRQVNLETIHNHDVLAERSGTVQELRSELETGVPLRRHTELRDWLAGREHSRPL